MNSYMSKAQGNCISQIMTPLRLGLNKLLKDHLVTLYLKTLCIMHYKRIHNVRCSALYLFINNCEKNISIIIILYSLWYIVATLTPQQFFLTYTWLKQLHNSPLFNNITRHNKNPSHPMTEWKLSHCCSNPDITHPFHSYWHKTLHSVLRR